MIRKVTVKIRYDRWPSVAALLVTAALVAVYLAHLLWGQTQVVAETKVSQSLPAPLAASAAATDGVREYYLTQSITFDGNEAASACAAGYHMASTWELLDTSNLQYNPTLGRTRADSGNGPPYDEGWARTGYGADTSGAAGQANCNGWSSDNGGDSGTSLRLPYDWTVGQDLSTWMAGTWACNTNMPVWCVEDEGSDAGTAAVGMRQYYLTTDSNLIGSQPTTACATGYHMASLWEILDPSNLRYNVELGDSRMDSGLGPIAATYGWVRTGYEGHDGTNPAHEAGRPNCSAWTSGSSGDYGTVVALPSDWTDANLQDVSVWDAALRQCSEVAPVWCVADEVDTVGTCSIPQPVVACGQQVNGDTAGYASHHDSYSCSGWDESGPEIVYGLDLPTTFAPYTVTATLSNMSVDLDVYILSSAGCGAGTCQSSGSYGNFFATATGLAGDTYYIAVDGYDGAVGSYTLSVECDYRKVFLPLTLRDF